MNKSNDVKIDVSSILQRAKLLKKTKIKGVSISLPFLSIDLEISDNEKRIAREVLIRLRDKRVLIAWECCDNCITKSLASIQDIRNLLVNKQVELSDDNSVLFILFDLMLAGIRQFLTFAESSDPRRHRDAYYGALEILRGHLLRCIGEIGKVGNVKPELTNRLNFNPTWEDKIYFIESAKSGRKK
jgi:hypothetical protein